jgi:hypothetical protein
MKQLASKSKETSIKQVAQKVLLHAGFFFGLYSDPEDGGNMFLRNICWLSVDCMVLNPRKQNSSRICSLASCKNYISAARGLYLSGSSS